MRSCSLVVGDIDDDWSVTRWHLVLHLCVSVCVCVFILVFAMCIL